MLLDGRSAALCFTRQSQRLSARGNSGTAQSSGAQQRLQRPRASRVAVRRRASDCTHAGLMASQRAGTMAAVV